MPTGKHRYPRRRRQYHRNKKLRRLLPALAAAAAVLLLAFHADAWLPYLLELTEDTGWHTDATDGKESATLVDGELAVHFLDVGQGNAVLITDGTSSMLVDGGGRDYSSYVVSYLERQDISALSYVISSHYDADHIHGLIGVLNVYSVDMLLDGDYEWDTATYTSYRSAAEANGCTEIHPQAGEVYQLGDATFTIVCPDSYNHEDSNDNSIGIRLVYGSTSFLLCGDADSEMETWMIESSAVLDSDVLLCSHHGSASSTSEAFLEAVSPDAVVISCGTDNSYGHPSQRVMSLLEEYGCDVYRTDKQSTIIAVTDGTTITFENDPTLDYSAGSVY